MQLYFDASSRLYAVELVRAYRDGFRERVLSAFKDIESAADKASRDRFDELMSRPATEDNFDYGSEAAEDARDHGIQVYTDLKFVEQQVTGLATAGLFHLWERLLKGWLVREVGHDQAAAKHIQKANFKTLIDDLTETGWDVRGQSFYLDLNHLRLIANTIKHGDGPDCTQLMKEGRRFFRKTISEWLDSTLDVSDLEITNDHFDHFAKTVEEFFRRIPERFPPDKISPLVPFDESDS